MVNGIALGGVASGIDEAEKRLLAEDQIALATRLGEGRLAQGERGLDIQERRLGLEAQRIKNARDVGLRKLTSDQLTKTKAVISNIIKDSVDAGADPEKIRKTIEPLMSDIDTFAQATGQDPATIRRQFEAEMNVPRKLKPLTESGAARLVALQTAQKNFGSLIENVDKDYGAPLSSRNFAAMGQWSAGFGKPYQAWIKGVIAVEGILRNATGAQAPDTEYRRYAKFLMPTPFDSTETRKLKLSIITEFMGNGIQVLQAGREQVFDVQTTLNTLESFKQQIDAMGGETQQRVNNVINQFDQRRGTEEQGVEEARQLDAATTVGPATQGTTLQEDVQQLSAFTTSREEFISKARRAAKNPKNRKKVIQMLKKHGLSERVLGGL